MRKIVFIILLMSAPCYGEESYVELRDYVDRLIIEQNRYIDTRFNSINDILQEKQRALEVGSDVLDAKFVRIDDFIKSGSQFSNGISNLTNRMTILETRAESQETQTAKWVIWIGIFFTVVQIGIAIFRRKDKTS